jgi:elongation factor 1 alpha-like protein
MNTGSACSNSFSFLDFFLDTPWLNIPKDREAVLIAPLYPRGGLLGGSSEEAPKMSKLQALAAARKKKAQEEKAKENTGVEKPLAKLKIKEDVPFHSPSKTGNASTASHASKPTSRGFPARKRKDSNEHEKAPKAPSPKKVLQSFKPESPEDTSEADQGEPSAFANTMFNSRPKAPRKPQNNLFTLTFAANTSSTTANPFAGPSPDDIVIAAQSKGSTNPARTRNFD